MLYLVLVGSLIINHLISSCDGHPQCLDFQPPYQPTNSLEFCKQYSNYTCCSNSKDHALQFNFKHVTERSGNNTDQICYDVAKELICMECHPYAAHVFDAEQVYSENAWIEKRSVTFPGLCRKYCLNIFDKCRHVFLNLATTEKFHKFVKTTNTSEFCSWAEIPDENYCYPEVNNLHKKRKALEKTYKNKLCVKPFTTTYFANALVAVHSNDKTHRLFIGEQRGLVYVILPNGTTLEKPFLNITERIINSGSPWDERGFLGLVFHPKYEANGRFFIYYSAPGERKKRSEHTHFEWYWKEKHRIRISEFTVDPNDPYVADHNSELPLLEIHQPEPNHNGGMIAFGDDGYLYIFVGDGGGSGDVHGTHGNAINMSTLLGKVLRVNIDSEDHLYDIPKDNPFINYKNVTTEIYAFGVRNPWRCSVDRGDNNGRKKGRILCGDVGQYKYEEINIIEKGKNYGWRAFEGFSCFDKNICGKHLRNVQFPIMAYNHSIGQSIVGGYVYRGCDNPNIYGKYIFGDTMNGRLFIADEDGNKKWNFEELLIGNSTFCNNGLNSYYHKNILSFGESESGELYMLSTLHPHPHSGSSVIYRLVDPTRRGDPESCRFKPKTPKALKTIKRRRVFEKMNKTKITNEIVDTCIDTKSDCYVYYESNGRKKSLLDCKLTKQFSSVYCKRTCHFC